MPFLIVILTMILLSLLEFMPEKRASIMKEVLNSERIYVSRMQAIVDYYMTPIRSKRANEPNGISFSFRFPFLKYYLIFLAQYYTTIGNGIISEHHFKTLFSEIEVIVFYNGVRI